MSLSLHPLTKGELSAADRILMAAFHSPSRRDELALYLALQPDGWLLATLDGAPVGLGGVTSYGPFAYLGLMAVDPEMQRRGIGQALVEALIARARELGCAMVLLDASDAGAPLYARLGFVEDDRARIYTQATTAPVEPTASQTVAPLREADLPALVAFDARYFGAAREAVLALCLHHYADRSFATRDETGAITGYLIAQDQRLGPWVAATPVAAEALLAHAVTRPFATAPVALVPAANRDAVALLERSGFTTSRDLRHMRYGGALALERRRHLYGQASFAIG
jgi:predicted N-acetyltransferase YhbS